MNDSSARVVLDSVGPHGKRLISVEMTYWRMIHSEIMTHRDRARSSASSRAIPFYRESKGKAKIEAMPPGAIPIGKGLHSLISGDADEEYDYVVPNCTYSRIRRNPFVPEFIGSEKPGMQAGAELAGKDREEVERIIMEMRDFCLAGAKRMFDLGAHKSIVNRYVEPWSYITILMTATNWNNFFRLRVHPKAERHFNKVATQVRDAILASTPQILRPGEWHMPYIRPEDWQDADARNIGAEIWSKYGSVINILTRVSAGRCARLSYLTHDGYRNLSEDLRLFESLINPIKDDGMPDEAIHAAAIEHTAQCMVDGDYRSGPFVGWHQLRKDYPNECAKE